MAVRLALVVSLVLAGWSSGDVAAGQERPDVVPVTLQAEEASDEFSPRDQVIDDLGGSSVLKISASGFPSFDRVEVMQCVYQSTRSCSNRLPVQVDESGRAAFQYLAIDDFSVAAIESGRCRPDRNRCTVRMQTPDRSKVAEIDTVFNGLARPAGQITLTPQRELVDGSTVRVSVTGYPPGATFDAVLCRGPEAPSPRVCGEPGPSAPVTIGPDGSGAATVTIAQGPVGTSASRCTRRSLCGVTLVSPDTYVRAATVPITFAGRAGPEYEQTRLAAGLGVAALLLGLALWWMVTGEWGPPQEADASDLDDAEYADLDAMVDEQDAKEIAAGVSPDPG